MVDDQGSLASGRHLARNFLWSLLGNGAPIVVAIVAIPILIGGLGTARFGVLSLAWIVVGYFSLFDLGLGRALTKLVAEKLGRGLKKEIPSLAWTALSFMAVLGAAGAGVVAALSPWLVGKVLKIPPELERETLSAFYLLAISIPIVIGSTGMRGVLEAYQRFDLVNAVRIPVGILTFLGPLAVLAFSKNLVPIVTVLVITRLISWCVYALMCFQIEPALRHSIQIRRSLVRPLISFGGWMTVSNIVGPIMVYMDRFLIGAVVSISAVAYYTAPYEIVTKLWIISGALMGVMFPAFASALVVNRDRATRLFVRSVKYIFLILFPVALTIVTLAHEGLTLWLGSEFAENSSLVLQVLTIGVFINSLAQVPFGMLQAQGRPDLTAKLHVGELLFYLPILWWSLSNFGIVGAAVAWVLRILIDSIFLFFFANQSLSIESSLLLRASFVIGVTFILLLAGTLLDQLISLGVFLIIVLSAFYFAAWQWLLDVNEKEFLLGRLKRRSGAIGE